MASRGSLVTCVLFVIVVGIYQCGAAATTHRTTRSPWGTTNPPSSSCGGSPITLQGAHGLILSPHYPDTYDAQTTCQWNLKVNASHVIKLTFYTPFALEYDDQCRFDSVQVYDVMPSGQWKSKGIWCGTTPPPDMTSLTSAMVLVFKSDYKSNMKGFSASWNSVVQCGGISSDSHGVMTSPDYPYSYPHNLHCRWDVSAPTGSFVKLDFPTTLNLDFDANGDCGQDMIEIFDVLGNGTMVRREIFCGGNGQAPPPIQSFGSRIVVDFRSGNSRNNRPGTGFKVTWQQVTDCTHTLSANQGYLMSSDYPTPTPHTFPTPADCAWTITAPGPDPSQFHVRLTFDTDTPVECDQFTIVDGSNNSSLCKTLINGSVTSSGHVMTIEHRGKNSTYPFFASWEIVCGGVLTARHGQIKTPSFPSGYPSNLECVWEIRDPDPRQHFIKLEFDPVFDIEFNNNNCSSDYVEVLSSPPGHAPLPLIKSCGGTSPQTQVSYFSPMRVVFHSDGTKNHKGFSATWTSGMGCSDVISGESGVLSFPNVDYPYPSNFRCTWDIHVPDNYVIKLDVIAGSQLEKAADTLKVYDIYPDTHLVQTATLTGYLPARTLMSKFSSVRLVFQSDSTTNYKGFTIKWAASCGGVHNTSQGNISSPNYGSRDYLNDLDCLWRINVPVHHTIRLTFDTPFELEAANNVTCPYDNLELFDTLPSGQLVSKGRFCGDVTPSNLISGTSSMAVKFHTDGDKTGKGFGLSWDSACGNIYHSSQGSVKSPNFPGLYPNNFDCRWEMEVQEGNVIRLSFQQPFSLESDDQCRYDYVEVFDYDSSGKEVKMGHWCGSSMPPLLLSTGSRMLVTFHSDDGKNGGGFHATYEAVCGDVFYTTQGNFTSPLYPRGYPGNMDCRWEINLDPGQRIQLTFDPNFDLEMNRFDCSYDDIEVLDSFSNNSLISNGRWCGQNNPPALTSFNPRLVVLFHSDVNKDGEGFSVSWTSVPGCGGVYDRPTGYIMSTNYPSLYPDKTSCRWEIKPRDTAINNITLTFDSVFDMEAGKACDYDYLEVTDGASSLGRFCGKVAPMALTSVTGHMVIQFSTDKSNSGKGFFASWVVT